MSTADVASSSNSRRGRERIERARHRSCFWPCERLDPADAIGDDRERKILTLLFVSRSTVTAVLLVVADDSAMGCSASGMGVLSEDGTRCTR
jgi:hypothetical protein